MIHADDLRVGMYLTLSEWLTACDRSYRGDVLLVKAVNLPFIAVAKLRPGGNGEVAYAGGNIHLDTREVDLLPLRPDYVQAIIGAPVTEQAQANAQQAHAATVEQSPQRQ